MFCVNIVGGTEAPNNDELKGIHFDTCLQLILHLNLLQLYTIYIYIYIYIYILWLQLNVINVTAK